MPESSLVAGAAPQSEAGNGTSSFNYYVDAISKLATNGSAREHDNARARSKMDAIVAGLANFSTSESGEVLLDTDNGSRNGAAEDGPGGDRDLERSFRGGGNFMLLLEDFGEYFYNFNGTTGATATGEGGGAVGGLNAIEGGVYSNFSSNYDSLANCSLANSTCGVPPVESKWQMKF